MPHTADTIPIVDPMMVRKITPLGTVELFGGVVTVDEFDIEDIGLADKRLDYDDDIVDCSNRIFEITHCMIVRNCTKSITVFPSRRWRNLRHGEYLTGLPSKDEPLLYIGNPIRIMVGRCEWPTVIRNPEFLITSGVRFGD